ncbi:MAG: adenylate/guanylate cyclase domain-containing protein [Hypericibacter sp.]
MWLARMVEERAQRRLAAILAADVVGYSRLMQRDEAGTLAALKARRSEILQPTVSKHHGRIVKLMGDGALIEFGSAVDAVECAARLQQAMDAANASVAQDGQIVLRIGINLGDVLVEGGDLYGDGVNIAARLEALADPGGVFLSRTVFNYVKGKTRLEFEDLGERSLKNMAEPVQVYRVSGLATPLLPAVSGKPLTPSRPSIAVLPFLNMSGDPEQEYFADGITEDIITDLSRWPSLAVTSRNSTFRFKGKPVDMSWLGRELGARFLVEGSVRRMGERIRITAQLIDAETGNHVWAERYDRAVADLFALQDEVVRTIVGTLVGRVQVNEAERARRKPPTSLAAYDLMLRGNALSWDDPTEAAEAKRAFERAIEIDPGYGLPHSLLAAVFNHEWANDLSASRELMDRAFALALRAVELADNESTCHTILGQIYLDRGSFDLALRHMERGVQINPVNQWNQADYGAALSQVGRAEEGLEVLRNARRMDPYFGPPWYWRALGIAQFVLRRYADALADFDRGEENSSRYALAAMAGCCAKLGQADRARELVARCLAGQPGGTIEKVVARIRFKQAGDTQHLVECLRLAGMPE